MDSSYVELGPPPFILSRLPIGSIRFIGGRVVNHDRIPFGFMIHFSILPFDSYYEWFGKEDQASLIWEIVQLLPTVLFWIRLFFSKISRRKYIYRNLFDLSLVIMLLGEKLN